jgi:hypothetical protein
MVVKSKITIMAGRPRSTETIILTEALPGVTFFTEKKAEHIQALASRHERKVTTRKFVAVPRKGDIEAIEIQLVTIVE